MKIRSYNDYSSRRIPAILIVAEPETPLKSPQKPELLIVAEPKTSMKLPRNPALLVVANRKKRLSLYSDVHLGCRHSQVDAFVTYLNSVLPENLYLVGDFLDAWKPRSLLRWGDDYNRVFERLAEMAAMGTRIYFTPGNHDAFLRVNPFLRAMVEQMSMFEIADEYIFTTIDGRRFLVTHGDQFDDLENGNFITAVIAEIFFPSILWSNKLINRIFRLDDRTPYSQSGRFFRWLKRLVGFQDKFEQQLSDLAMQRGCSGVICGHIHSPAIRDRGDVVFCNTGDWVENCTGMVEHEDGSLEIEYFYPAMRQTNAEPCPRPIAIG